MANTTCQVYESSIQGNVTEMNRSQLPTYGDVIKCIIIRKSKITNEYGGKNRSLSRVPNHPASNIAAVYQRTSVPAVNQKAATNVP